MESDQLIGGTYATCSICGHQGYAYGSPNLHGVSIAYCSNCGVNDSLIATSIMYELYDKKGRKTVVTNNKHIWKNKHAQLIHKNS